MIWLCDDCHKPIVGNTGYFRVSHEDIARHDDAARAWEAKYAHKAAVTLEELCEHPRPARWTFHHDGCRPDGNGHAYSADIARVGTFRAALQWTAHLMEKNWLDSTDWRAVIERALELNPNPTKETPHGE